MIRILLLTQDGKPDRYVRQKFKTEDAAKSWLQFNYKTRKYKLVPDEDQGKLRANEAARI